MPLPSPYEPPWKRLGEDLVAVGAWALLKLQELGRRNREGSLPMPAYWPRQWSQLFWPLVLTITLLALVAGVGVGMRAERISLSPPPAPLEEAPPSEPTSEPAAEPDASPEAPPELEPQTPVEDLGTKPEDRPQVGSSAANGLDNETENGPENGEEERLRALLNPGDRESLVEGLRPDPDNGTLVLQLGDGFRTLPPASRLQQAERWQVLAADWGYRHLELVNKEGQLVGREAQVGEGMILFAAADAGGSLPIDGEAGKRDGMFGDRAGGAGGTLGSAPDARTRGWAGLLGRQRGGSDPADRGGVHRQPSAGAG